MTKDDIQGFMLIPFIFIGCIYHEELADVIGVAINLLFSYIG